MSQERKVHTWGPTRNSATAARTLRSVVRMRKVNRHKSRTRLIWDSAIPIQTGFIVAMTRRIRLKVAAPGHQVSLLKHARVNALKKAEARENLLDAQDLAAAVPISLRASNRRLNGRL